MFLVDQDRLGSEALEKSRDRIFTDTVRSNDACQALIEPQRARGEEVEGHGSAHIARMVPMALALDLPVWICVLAVSTGYRSTQVRSEPTAPLSASTPASLDIARVGVCLGRCLWLGGVCGDTSC